MCVCVRARPHHDHLHRQTTPDPVCPCRLSQNHKCGEQSEHTSGFTVLLRVMWMVSPYLISPVFHLCQFLLCPYLVYPKKNQTNKKRLLNHGLDCRCLTSRPQSIWVFCLTWHLPYCHWSGLCVICTSVYVLIIAQRQVHPEACWWYSCSFQHR